MSFLTLFLNQVATYWSPGVPDGFGGFTYDAPVELNCRWEDRVEVMTDTEGTQFVSKARIFLEDDVVHEGYLFLGVSTATDPQKVDDAYKIRVFAKIPDLLAENFERKAFL